MLPLFIYDVLGLIATIISIPSIIERYRDNNFSKERYYISGFREVIESIATLLSIVSHFTFIFRLDGILKCSYTVSLIPFFLYGLKNLVLPFIHFKEHKISKSDMISDICSIVYYVTVLFICLKVDGIIQWKWGATFIILWIYYGISIIKDIFVMYFSNDVFQVCVV